MSPDRDGPAGQRCRCGHVEALHLDPPHRHCRYCEDCDEFWTTRTIAELYADTRAINKETWRGLEGVLQ